MTFTIAITYGAFTAGIFVGWCLCALMIVGSDADRAFRDEGCE